MIERFHKTNLITSSILTALILVVYFTSVAISAVSTSNIISKLRKATPVVSKVDPEVERNITALKAVMSGEDPEVIAAYAQLLGTKNKSKLIASCKTQVLKWIGQKQAGEEIAFEYPLSNKQFAWVLYILNPGKYLNPKEDPAIYPELHEAGK